MHLINVETYELEEHLDPGPYAILSHTWRDREEVSHREYREDQLKARKKNGFRKIEYLCTQAVEDQLRLAWIDTVCIDKTSSAELSEAINSMFAWYQEAKICYVYLDDVDHVSEIPKCRWITRGWTLQELLAPKEVRFYSRDWLCIGTKASLVADLVRCTNIDQIALTDSSTIQSHSAATRMSWAASRKTTRIEDMAYCLLGIFGVNMPLLYGERSKAFHRLQEQILRQYRDTTILAFNRKGLDYDGSNLLAQNPDIFGTARKVLSLRDQSYCELTSRGLQLYCRVFKYSGNHYAVLDCRHEYKPDTLIALPIAPWSALAASTSKDYLAEPEDLYYVQEDECAKIPYENIIILYKTYINANLFRLDSHRFVCSVEASGLLVNGYEVICAEPEDGICSWNSANLVSEMVTKSKILIQKFAFVNRTCNEAFIVQFVLQDSKDVRSTTGERKWYNVVAKAEAVSCSDFLRHHEMYSVIKRPPSQSDWHKTQGHLNFPTSRIIDGESWALVDKEGNVDRILPLGPTKSYLSVRIQMKVSSYRSIVKVSPYFD